MNRCALAMLILISTALALYAGAEPELVRVQDKGKASLLLPRRDGDPFKVKLSQSLTIVMRVEADAPLEVQFSEKTHSTEGWQLERIGEPKTTKVGGSGRVRWEQIFHATPLGEPGPQPLPLPALQFTEKNHTPEEITWTPLPLTIVTRVPKVDISEARDLAPIEELPPPLESGPHWWPWLLAGVPFLAIVVWLVQRRRSRPPLELGPVEVALRQIAELAAWHVVGPDDVERLHIQLSDVLRRYLEKRFDLPATRRTTAEFFAALATAGSLANGAQTLLSDIFQRCDEAKFAGVVPGAAECQRLVTLARSFVEETAKAPASSSS
jgi:hypothetical protein